MPSVIRVIATSNARAFIVVVAAVLTWLCRMLLFLLFPEVSQPQVLIHAT